MNNLWFYSKTFFDLLQWFSLAWFNLSLFRINPKKYLLQSVFFALLCHFVPDGLSAWLNVPSLRVFIQVSMEILCLWGIFMIPFVSSMVIAVMSSVIMIFLQIPIMVIVAFITRTSLQSTISHAVTYHYCIIILIFLTFLLSSYLSSKRLGFSFISVNHHGYPIKKEQKSLLLALIGMMITLIFLPYDLTNLDILFAVIFVIMIIAWFIFRYSILKELED